MKRKRIIKSLFKIFITINLLSFLVFISAVDGDNFKTPLIMIAINLGCIVISGFFY